jgi:hypothetical protein
MRAGPETAADACRQSTPCWVFFSPLTQIEKIMRLLYSMFQKVGVASTCCRMRVEGCGIFQKSSRDASRTRRQALKEPTRVGNPHPQRAGDPMPLYLVKGGDTESTCPPTTDNFLLSRCNPLVQRQLVNAIDKHSYFSTSIKRKLSCMEAYMRHQEPWPQNKKFLSIA